MLLHEILNNIPVTQFVGSAEQLEIDNISIDSRNCKNGTIFFALKGFKTDGHKFIPQAISNGASAVVMDEDQPGIDQLISSSKVAKILVKNSREALAQIANVFYGNPSSKLNLVGITGTKGKTTTSYFLKNIFETAGMKTGLIGTNKNMIGEKKISTKLTTPESHIINNLMSEMVKEHCSNCVMEVSSHAVELNRISNLDFNIGVFTNITSDHLDFHETFENYMTAKSKFFQSLKPTAKIIYNKDDKNYESILKSSVAEKISYSLKNEADFKVENVEYNLDGTKFRFIYQEKKYDVETELIGTFNAYNAIAAIGSAIYSNVSVENAIEGIYATPQVPGRFEVIASGNKRVIIDYSHTADSLNQALNAIKHIVKSERPIYTVFGCGGDRDKTKRPIMGKIAVENSSFVYVTSDNPRSENPFDIINDITKNLNTKNYNVIENREEAIKSAITDSEENAVILIAGKGHENYQEINGVRNFFSDKETAEKYL
ncbi:MAG: UDP-N-acetylmuramoyl-L-alanyl-D-glutamate--2,6-diaminopimelate ligase [Ignavibacteriae bacterium]|nr:UDP-N-acetylmuramoyl-L-alanyl-D-glutamate--2,6-diaminopimelate ligase [Ignavibacteriota bacterium]